MGVGSAAMGRASKNHVGACTRGHASHAGWAAAPVLKKSVEADFAEKTRLFFYLSCKLQKSHNFPYLCHLIHNIGRYYLKNVWNWYIYNHRENSDILVEVRAICSIVINKLMEKIFFLYIRAWKFFSSSFFHGVDWNQCSITIHTQNIIFHIVINKFHELIQWTGAAVYKKFLFFCLIMNFICENYASINGKHNQGYLHLLLTILINKCIKRSLFGRKNSFFFVKSSIIYQK